MNFPSGMLNVLLNIDRLESLEPMASYGSQDESQLTLSLNIDEKVFFAS